MGAKHATFTGESDDGSAGYAGVKAAGRWVDEDREYRPRQFRVSDADASQESDDIDWDDVADVICVGGRLGVATAIAAREVGLDVILVDAQAQSIDGAFGLTDPDTVEYLRSLTEDFDPVTAVDPEVPVRVVDGPAQPEPRGSRLPTFHGAALRDWGSACVASRFGLLYTRVHDPRLSVTYTGPGGSIEATVLATIDLDAERPTDSLENWLSTLDGEELNTSGSLERLVFDNGVVVGAALASATGVRMVRARHGVMLSPLGSEPEIERPAGELNAGEAAEVALVSRAASRFARLELLRRS
ncbi:hypothetical protein BVC93_16500 [Mycobacterium sp. MS1601]|uniref:hypothetical protein n=1 Tax=Mycobacterium sp. MS1601 TaxID=1936029 RepID=UPI000979256B|nr:hypothetical protein [Mycobacterium sp. MS1601]AQA03762.1 hypothetical protein BVC93_16500 [Mycobacterium sp. MS1601]